MYRGMTFARSLRDRRGQPTPRGYPELQRARQRFGGLASWKWRLGEASLERPNEQRETDQDHEQRDLAAQAPCGLKRPSVGRRREIERIVEVAHSGTGHPIAHSSRPPAINSTPARRGPSRFGSAR